MRLNFSENIFDNDLNEIIYVRILKKPAYGLLYYCKNIIKKYEKKDDDRDGYEDIYLVDCKYKSDEYSLADNIRDICQRVEVNKTYQLENFYYLSKFSVENYEEIFEYDSVDSDELYSNAANVTIFYKTSAIFHNITRFLLSKTVIRSYFLCLLLTLTSWLRYYTLLY